MSFPTCQKCGKDMLEMDICKIIFIKNKYMLSDVYHKDWAQLCPQCFSDLYFDIFNEMKR